MRVGATAWETSPTGAGRGGVGETGNRLQIFDPVHLAGDDDVEGAAARTIAVREVRRGVGVALPGNPAAGARILAEGHPPVAVDVRIVAGGRAVLSGHEGRAAEGDAVVSRGDGGGPEGGAPVAGGVGIVSDRGGLSGPGEGPGADRGGLGSGESGQTGLQALPDGLAKSPSGRVVLAEPCVRSFVGGEVLVTLGDEALTTVQPGIWIVSTYDQASWSVGFRNDLAKLLIRSQLRGDRPAAQGRDGFTECVGVPSQRSGARTVADRTLAHGGGVIAGGTCAFSHCDGAAAVGVSVIAQRHRSGSRGEGALAHGGGFGAGSGRRGADGGGIIVFRPGGIAYGGGAETGSDGARQVGVSEGTGVVGRLERRDEVDVSADRGVQPVRRPLSAR